MNKLQKAVAEFIKKNAAISKKASDEILSQLTIDTTPKQLNAIVDKIWKKYDIQAVKKELLLNHIVAVTEISAGVKYTNTQVNSFKAWYLENAYSPSGEKFKTVYNGIGGSNAVKQEIRQSLQAGQSWRSTAQKLTDKKLVKSAIAKDVETVLNKARGVYGLSQNSEGYTEYKKAVRSVQARINRLTDQDTSKLKRAYQDILDLTNKSSAAQIESAAKYASYFKDRYNAETIARTEITKAYGDASISNSFYELDVIGIQFVLSSGHPEVDECDYHTSVDLYDMGAGIYPRERSPEYPFHPNCLCGVEMVYSHEAPANGASDYNAKGGEKYLKSISEGKRKSILGVGGNEKFKENTKKWSKEFPDLSKQETKKPTIPNDKLYGK